MAKIVHWAAFKPPANLAPDQPYRLIGSAVVGGAVIGTVAWAVAVGVEWWVASKTGALGGVSHMPLSKHALYWFETFLHREMRNRPFADNVAAYQYGLDQMNWWLIKGKAALATVPGVGVGAYITAKMNRVYCNSRHLFGMQFHDGKDAVKLAEQAVLELNGDQAPFLPLHPELTWLSQQAWSTSAIIMGAAGSGKSAILAHLTYEALVQNVFMVIMDAKGTQSHVIKTINKQLGRRSDNVATISPFSDTDAAWDIGRDLVRDEDATVFANAYVPPSNDPMWSDGARGILRTIVLSMIVAYREACARAEAAGVEKPKPWHWGHLAYRIQSAMKDIYTWAAEYDPATARLIADYEKSNTVKSFEVTFRTFSLDIIKLGKAWGEPADGEPKRRRVSLRLFVDRVARNGRKGVHQIVLRNNLEYKALTKGYLLAMHAFLTAKMLSLSDNPTDGTGRTLLFMEDEFTSQGKKESIFDALELGRSKGMVHVIAVQTEDALVELYGQEGRGRISGNTTIKILGRAAAPEMGAQMAANFPKRTVQITHEGRPAAKGQPATPTTYESVEVPVIRPEILSSTRDMGKQRGSWLGGRKAGIKAVVRIGSDLYHLLWPFIAKDKMPSASDASVPPLAAWLVGGKVPALQDYAPMVQVEALMAQQAAAQAEATAVPTATANDDSGGAALDAMLAEGASASEEPSAEHAAPTASAAPAPSNDRPLSPMELYELEMQRKKELVVETVEVDVERDSEEYQHAVVDAANLQREQERRGDWHDPGEIDESTSLLLEAVAGQVAEAIVPGGHLVMEALKIAEGAQAPAKNVENVIDNQTGEVRQVTVVAPKKQISIVRQVPARTQTPESEPERSL
ncbi:type IV secretory system conjugative DNA transfer family protein [Burkholderia vietnamiensis]|uniref:type IV secretory system conjugative DNA transfer family protein n=1 Tax=Burkholderia vietnamiensis TaxID=60552 RepID=UPI001CF4C95F|nr:type IV secretion system DNA-binding domain-containing protein [Burkholderia vietnamiensis]MCA8148096.1 type IV secretion system DNA-binding domain-containing protein [Burkholderia vietnamiensis]